MPLIEELDTKKHIPAPGYAYVPDTGPKIPSALVAATTGTGGRQRAARNLGGNKASAALVETIGAKQDAKLLRKLAELDRDNSSARDRDVSGSVPVPVRHRDNAGRASHGKVSSNVRKILASNKTFANYLSDAEAEAALKASQPQSSSSNQGTSNTNTTGGPSTPATRVPPGQAPIYGPTPLTSKGTKSHKKKIPLNSVPTISTPLRRVTTPITTSTSSKSGGKGKGKDADVKAEASKDGDGDISMSDIPATNTNQSSDLTSTTSQPKPLPQHKHFDLTPPSPEIPAHQKDTDPLLISRIPPLPTADEIDRLLSIPPLSYNEARARVRQSGWGVSAGYTGGGGGKTRVFCEICGYWGRVRCLKCGGRVCGVECLGVHDEYGCVKFYA